MTLASQLLLYPQSTALSLSRCILLANRTASLQCAAVSASRTSTTCPRPKTIAALALATVIASTTRQRVCSSSCSHLLYLVSPPPGTYDVKVGQQDPAFSFGVGRASYEKVYHPMNKVAGSHSPGPGAYRYKQCVGKEGKQQSMGLKNSEFLGMFCTKVRTI